jgi:hypothetical protein
LLFLGTVIFVVGLIGAAWLHVSRPKGLMVVERLSPPTGHVDNTVRNTTELLSNFPTLAPADVWLTWQITAPVGADMRLTRLGFATEQTETRWTDNWRDWNYLVRIVQFIGVVLIGGGLLIPQRRARRPAKARAGAAR